MSWLSALRSRPITPSASRCDHPWHPRDAEEATFARTPASMLVMQADTETVPDPVRERVNEPARHGGGHDEIATPASLFAEAGTRSTRGGVHHRVRCRRRDRRDCVERARQPLRLS
jgi:hypothetical protein